MRRHKRTIFDALYKPIHEKGHVPVMHYVKLALAISYREWYIVNLCAISVLSHSIFISGDYAYILLLQAFFSNA